MKKIFKKNQVIITALAIMIAVAGYLNFTEDQKLLNTSVEDMKSEGASGNSDDDTISASVNDTVEGEEYADLDNTEHALEDVNAEIDENASVTDGAENELESVGEEDALETASADMGSEESPENEGEPAADAGTDETSGDEEDGTNLAEASVDENGDPIDAESVGEAVLTNASVTLSQAKLNREQTRSKSKEMLLEIINNEGLSEDSKQEAIDKMLSLTERMEKETAAETQLSAKGFVDSVVSISDESVDVTVSMDSLTDTQRTQIEDIIMRKTGCELNQIVITTTN